MKYLGLFTLLVALFASTATRAEVNAPADRIVILISIDGCRWDYLSTFNPPTLSQLAAEGVRAEKMLSCFPSSTFPNHYTIATGLRPEHHGIVANGFYDPTFKTAFTKSQGSQENRWWGGEPIWVTARKQGRRTACEFWPGSETPIHGLTANYWNPYDWKATCSDRAQVVLKWLSLPPAERPQFITLYFDVVDGAGHDYGPATPQVRDALMDVDHAIGELVAGVKALGLDERVNYVITSDHGMAQINRERRIVIDDYVDPTTIDIDYMGAYALIRPHDGNAQALVDKFATMSAHGHAYLADQVPADLNYRGNLRIGPVVVVLDAGWTIGTREFFAGLDQKNDGIGGAHGYDPRTPDMGATFIACGPDIVSGKVIEPFENIQIYDLICSLLGVQPAPNDGDHRLVYWIMKP